MAHRPDILCLSETKIEEPNQLTIRQIGSRKINMWIVKNGTGASGGIIMVYNTEIYELMETWEGEYSLILCNK